MCVSECVRTRACASLSLGALRTRNRNDGRRNTILTDHARYYLYFPRLTIKSYIEPSKRAQRTYGTTFLFVYLSVYVYISISICPSLSIYILSNCRGLYLYIYLSSFQSLSCVSLLPFRAPPALSMEHTKHARPRGLESSGTKHRSFQNGRVMQARRLERSLSPGPFPLCVSLS